MKITIDRRRTWTPDFLENLALPEEERVSFSFDKPQAYRRDSWTRVVASRDSQGNVSTHIEKNQRQIILDSNVSIEGLTVVEDGKERAITTGRELLDTRSDLCSVLVALLVSEIMKEDYKAELPS